MFQFEENLKNIKNATKKWLPISLANKVQDINLVEHNIAALHNLLELGPLSPTQLDKMKDLEKRKCEYLSLEE
jgi:hypothetical protein